MADDLQETIDYVAITRLQSAYADVVNRRAWHEFDDLFRPGAPLDYHYRDVPRQKQLLREHFADMGWQVLQLLDELDHTPTFYFDSITQLRLETWSRGRVTLVGDAGYCPGPAVGGSTSLAVVGAYTLAGELATHVPDHSAAFSAYEHEIEDSGLINVEDTTKA